MRSLEPPVSLKASVEDANALTSDGEVLRRQGIRCGERASPLLQEGRCRTAKSAVRHRSRLIFCGGRKAAFTCSRVWPIVRSAGVALDRRPALSIACALNLPFEANCIIHVGSLCIHISASPVTAGANRPATVEALKCPPLVGQLHEVGEPDQSVSNHFLVVDSLLYRRVGNV
jgi:hypothetical protein